jgi:voltage-dependent calcium channel
MDGQNFEVAEEHKKAHQVQAYLQRAEPTAMSINWLDRFNPYRRLKANPKSVNVVALPGHLVLPLKKSVVREYRAPGESSVSPGTYKR